MLICSFYLCYVRPDKNKGDKRSSDYFNDGKTINLFKKSQIADILHPQLEYRKLDQSLTRGKI